MIEVLKQMVKALESATVDCSNFHHAKKDQNHHLGECPPVIRWHHAIEAGKQAIAELESQEPVAWMDGNGNLFPFVWNVGIQQGSKYLDETLTPLYTTPPQREWIGLTDEEISELIRATHNTGSFVRAIEAKLKEKNCL